MDFAQSLPGDLTTSYALELSAAGLANTTERASRNLLDAGSEFLTQPKNPVEHSGLLAVNRYQSLGMLVDLIA